MSINMKLFDDKISDDELLKALDMTSGANLIQDMIDTAIAEAIEVNNPLRQNMPRKKGEGSQYIANRRTARGAAAFVDDTEEPSAVNSTYAQKGFAYKTIFYRGKVTRKLQAAGKSYGEALQDEIESGLQEVRDVEENAIINGNSSSPKEFDGLNKLCSAGVYNRTQDVEAPISKAILDEAIDQVIGQPNMIITSRRVAREINALNQEFQRFNDTIEVKGGFRVSSYDGIPIYKSIYVPTNEGTETNESRIYIVEYGTDVFMSELTALKLERLAKKSSQYDEFDIYEDLALAIKNPLKVWEVTGIQPPA